MSNTKSLSDGDPSISVGGERFHYGRDPKSGQYLVEHETDGGHRWAFSTDKGLTAFLEVLAAGEQNARILKRDKFGEGTYTVSRYYDLASVEPEKWLLTRVTDQEEQAVAFGDGHDLGEIRERLEAERDLFRRRTELSQVSPLTKNLYTACVVGRMPDAEVMAAFRIITTNHLEALRSAIREDQVTPRELDHALGHTDRIQALIKPRNPYHGINFASDAHRELDEAHELTSDLYYSIVINRWPSADALIDFAIDSEEHLSGLMWAVRTDQVTPKQLDQARCDADKLEALITPTNPYYGIEFGFVVLPADIDLFQALPSDRQTVLTSPAFVEGRDKSQELPVTNPESANSRLSCEEIERLPEPQFDALPESLHFPRTVGLMRPGR
jgi:hypothetical protein